MDKLNCFVTVQLDRAHELSLYGHLTTSSLCLEIFAIQPPLSIKPMATLDALQFSPFYSSYLRVSLRQWRQFLNSWYNTWYLYSRRGFITCSGCIHLLDIQGEYAECI